MAVHRREWCGRRQLGPSLPPEAGPPGDVVQRHRRRRRQQLEERAPEHPEVEAKGGRPHVGQVVLGDLRDEPPRIHADLPDPRASRPDPGALLLERRGEQRGRQPLHLRPGADEAHLPGDDVQELRQLVEVARTEELAERGVLDRRDRVLVGVDRRGRWQRADLGEAERASVPPDSHLCEDRPRPEAQRRAGEQDQQQREGDHEEQRSPDDVNQAMQPDPAASRSRSCCHRSPSPLVTCPVAARAAASALPAPSCSIRRSRRGIRRCCAPTWIPDPSRPVNLL